MRPEASPTSGAARPMVQTRPDAVPCARVRPMADSPSRAPWQAPTHVSDGPDAGLIPGRPTSTGKARDASPPRDIGTTDGVARGGPSERAERAVGPDRVWCTTRSGRSDRRGGAWGHEHEDDCPRGRADAWTGPTRSSGSPGCAGSSPTSSRRRRPTSPTTSTTPRARRSPTSAPRSAPSSSRPSDTSPRSTPRCDASTAAPTGGARCAESDPGGRLARGRRPARASPTRHAGALAHEAARATAGPGPAAGRRDVSAGRRRCGRRPGRCCARDGRSRRSAGARCRRAPPRWRRPR